MADLVNLLAQVPLFTTLPPAEILRLSDELRLFTAPPDEILFREGDWSDHFYIVVEGQLEVVKALDAPGERRIALRGPGEFVGEMSLFNPDGLRTASVRAHGTVQLMEMTRADFNALLHRQPLLAYEIVRVMSARLSSAHNTALEEMLEKNRQLTKAYEELKAAQRQIIEKEKLEHELQVAYEIQMSLLPQSMPQLPGCDFGARIVPARAVGGDLFDFIPLGAGKVGVVIGDVTDKGMPAAIFMAQAHALLRAGAGRDISPREVLRSANNYLLGMNSRGLFVTVVYGILDGATGAFTYARAGHEEPVVCNSQGELLPITPQPAMALGIVDDPELEEQTVVIPPGGVLLLFTDGVTDARNAQGEFFDEAGLHAALQEVHALPAQAMCDALMQRLLEHRGKAVQYDDITLVAIRHSGSGD